MAVARARARVAALACGVRAVILSPLIRMLASDNDGEALAAVRAIARKLAADGKDFHWLANRVDGGFNSGFGGGYTPPRTAAPDVVQMVGMDVRTAYEMVRFTDDRRHHLATDDAEWIEGLRYRYKTTKTETKITVDDFKRLCRAFRAVATKPEFG